MYVIINKLTKETYMCTDMADLAPFFNIKKDHVTYRFRKYGFIETNEFISTKIIKHIKSKRCNSKPVWTYKKRGEFISPSG